MQETKRVGIRMIPWAWQEPWESHRGGNANVMCGSVWRLGELKVRKCFGELTKVFKQILKYFHSKVKRRPHVPPGSSYLIPATSVLLTQGLYRPVPVVSKGVSCLEPIPELGTLLHFLSCQGLPSLDISILGSQTCFANSAISFLLPPGRNLIKALWGHKGASLQHL